MVLSRHDQLSNHTIAVKKHKRRLVWNAATIAAAAVAITLAALREQPTWPGTWVTLGAVTTFGFVGLIEAIGDLNWERMWRDIDAELLDRESRDTAIRAWDEGATAALTYAKRNDDGITLRLNRPNPYRTEGDQQ